MVITTKHGKTNVGTREAEHTTDGLASPDLRFRSSTLLWGPLRLTLTNFCEGANLGYYAGQAAYSDHSIHTLEEATEAYLATPCYAPRVRTPKIINEWRAMFVLGWASMVLSTVFAQTNRLGERIHV